MADNTNQDVNVTDQDALSSDEQALLDSMQAGDGDDGDQGAVAPAVSAGKKGPKAPITGKVAEGAEGEGAEGDGKGKEGKGGPLSPEALAAVREERAEKKALREELARANERFATLESRTNLILEKLVPKEKEPEPEKIPDMNDDPAGYIVAVMKQTGKSLETVQAELNTMKASEAKKTEAQKQHDAINTVISYAVTKENEFKQVTPDYDAASQHLIQTRKEELADMGYDENQANQIINTERLAIAQQCAQNGKNPAEVVYNIAKKRGYVAKKAEGDLAADDGKKKLEALRGGQEQGQSLSNTRGKGPSPLTTARLLEMSEVEFEKVINTPEGRALMGA